MNTSQPFNVEWYEEGRATSWRPESHRTGEEVDAFLKEHGISVHGSYFCVLVNDKESLTLEQWLKALEINRNRIASGLALTAEDSTEIGNKYTECSWGMCCDHKDVYPDPSMHIWPVQFWQEGRVAPLARPTGCRCPIDARKPGGDPHTGCFYSCRIFQAARGNRPTRETVLGWYESTIENVKRLIAERNEGEDTSTKEKA